MAPIAAANPRAVMTEITNSVLQNNPNGLPNIFTAGALKTKLWRARCKANPMPKIPKTHQDVMEANLPDKLTKTMDGQPLLHLITWKDDIEAESVLLFLSDPGAEYLRRAPVWMMDGTFKTAPVPYKQVLTV